MNELDKLKQKLLAELSVQYKNLVTFLSQVPISSAFRQYGFQNFDQGLMWFEKGIALIEQDEQKPDLESNQENNEPNKVNDKEKLN